MPDLRDLYNAEVGMNRVVGDYNTASLFTAYQTAMKNACVLMTAPVTAGTFASRYSASNITNVTNALQTAVDNLDADKIQSAGNVGILENGLTAGETAALVGADDQINFQDFELYGYLKNEEQKVLKRFMGLRGGYPTHLLLDASTMEILDYAAGWSDDMVTSTCDEIEMLLEML